MRDEIAQCAESIRQELARIGEVNILRLAEQLGERSLVVYQALGWLAREGGVRYLARGNQTYVVPADGHPDDRRDPPRPTEVMP